MATDREPLACITNSMRDVRSCTIKGEHSPDCNGWEYRWTEDRDREESTGDECRGCLPREAKQGLLCWPCWDSASTAVEGVPRLAQMLRGVDRAVQRDNGGVASQTLGYIPIPAVAVMLDELHSYLRSKRSTDTLAWVSTPVGAADAVRLGRAYSAAVKAHPTEERAHRIGRTRCTACNQLSLVWQPPQSSGEAVVVNCSNPECTAVAMDQTLHEVGHERQVNHIAAPIMEGGEPVTLVIEAAERYEPARPEHAGFDPLTNYTVKELRALAHDLDLPASIGKPELIAALRAAEMVAT
jgi:hypothetical protein